MAMTHAIPATVASIEIHLADILAPKHDLEVASRIGDTIRDAILITIAYRTNIRGFERPEGVKQAFLIQGANRFDGLGRCDDFNAVRVVNFGSQLWICGQGIAVSHVLLPCSNPATWTRQAKNAVHLDKNLFHILQGNDLPEMTPLLCSCKQRSCYITKWRMIKLLQLV